MRTWVGWALALVLAGCGGNAEPQGTGTGAAGGAGTTGSAGSTGSAGGAGGAGPSGALCPEVTMPPASCTPADYPPELVGFVADSGLIFRGSVTALHATTSGITVADTSRAIVVQVDEVLYDPGMLDPDGQAVTVELYAAPTMAVGYEGYFFTYVLELGSTIGVNEVAHVDPGVYPDLEQEVPAIEALLADESLYARMQTAESVLVGTVASIAPLPMTGPVSEHEPAWAEATITADCALRGAPLASAKVAFATSMDVAWFKSPKLAQGQQGVFLLQPAPSPPGAWPIPDGIPYVVDAPLDVQPLMERSHIATLVQCPPGQ